MSRQSRIALLATAALIAVGAFLLLRPGDDAVREARTTTSPPPPAATQPGQTAPAPTQPVPTPQPEPEPERDVEPALPVVAFRDGEPVGGVQRLEFRRGDEIAFRLRSDVAEEVHIHGYDRYVELRPGSTRTVRFEATLEGVFEIEMHGSGVQVAELRVAPS
jgi:hypothetical protein